MSETFKEKNQVTWNVNLGMTINFDPFAKEYSLNKQFKNLKEIQRINEEELNKTLNLQAIQIRNNLKMLDEQIKNANSKSGALKLRNLEAETMYSSGYISEVECSLQKLELQEAELAYTSLRLSKIIYYLQFYNKKQL
ncbi:TolC family protein [Treponema putidum]|uniref:TolC family protein n=1 Tax=Treponema putidum TaxID=221027 RepID=UPI003D8A7837